MDEIYTTTIISGIHLLDIKNADGDTSGTTTPNQWLVDWVRGGVDSDSGVAVNGETALQFAPLWNAVSKIAGHVGYLPCILYQSTGERSRERATRHPAYFRMKKAPNNRMTANAFKETLQQHALLWGNGRAAIFRNNRNDPAELIPLHPSVWDTEIVDGTKWHFTNSDPTAPNGRRRIHDDDVLHIPGLGYDGTKGYSVVQMARNSLGLGLAAEKASSKHFKNNAVPPLILQAPEGVFRDENDAQDFLRKFNEYHSGVDNSSKAGLLREGITANQLSMNSRDSQWIEQRLFQRQEAALWMCIESILGDDKSVSYNSLEAKNQAYLSGCLARWLNKWEQECDKKLLTDQQYRGDTHFFKFNTGALLRGTTKERFEVYQIGRMIEVFSANDVREMEDRNPIPDGDNYDNPAVKAPPSESSEQDEEAEASARLRTVIQSRLTEVVGVECKRIKQAAQTKNFLDWMETFYKSFTARLAACYQNCGGDDFHASEHVAESQRRLLAVAGDSTSETFSANIDAELATWPARILEATEELTR